MTGATGGFRGEDRVNVAGRGTPEGDENEEGMPAAWLTPPESLLKTVQRTGLRLGAPWGMCGFGTPYANPAAGSKWGCEGQPVHCRSGW